MLGREEGIADPGEDVLGHPAPLVAHLDATLAAVADRSARRRGLERVLGDRPERLRDGAPRHLQRTPARRRLDHDFEAVARKIAGRGVDQLGEREVDERLAGHVAGVGRHLLEDAATAVDLLADEAGIL